MTQTARPSRNDLGELSTEQRNPRTENIDVVSTLDMCRMISYEDSLVAEAVSLHLDTIARIIDAVSDRVRQGGRVIYLGAGTSGRLGVLDSSEIPPTYSADPGQFVGLIAGGDRAIRHPVEGAEDDSEGGVSDLERLYPPLSNTDSVIGLAASGRTPYVLGGMKHARAKGCFVGGVCCSADSEMARCGDEVVACLVGPEAVTGSTRMKSGTAQKMIINMISTGVQIRLGKTYGNLMVDVQTSNRKLVDRSRRIIRSVLRPLVKDTKGSFASQLEDDEALDAIVRGCGGSVKAAIVAIRWNCGCAEAVERLRINGGVLGRCLV